MRRTALRRGTATDCSVQSLTRWMAKLLGHEDARMAQYALYTLAVVRGDFEDAWLASARRQLSNWQPIPGLWVRMLGSWWCWPLITVR